MFIGGITYTSPSTFLVCKIAVLTSTLVELHWWSDTREKRILRAIDRWTSRALILKKVVKIIFVTGRSCLHFEYQCVTIVECTFMYYMARNDADIIWHSSIEFFERCV